jgi:hypothetical protein
MPMLKAQPVNTSAMNTANMIRPTTPRMMLTVPRVRVRPMREAAAPTRIAMMLPAMMTPCAPNWWKLISPLATFAFEPWKMPTRETPMPAMIPTTTIATARAPRWTSKTRRTPTIRLTP